MLQFLRNPEIQKYLFCSLLITALFTAAGFKASRGIYWILACGLCLTVFHLLFTYLRYQKLAALSRDLDNMLHNQTPVCFEAYAEGELSILQNELSKLTLRLGEQAEALSQDKKYLADSLADISHQLRSPLTSINLILSILKEPGLSAERHSELLLELSRLTARIDWLVNTLLKMSRMDARTVRMTKKPVSVARLLEEASAPLLIPMELREQTLHICPETGRESFDGDLPWTKEAILNILKNCMEHTQHGGTVKIFCYENMLFTQIMIEDNGPGFTQRDLPHLFERFYKGEHSGDQNIGIGLALARMIISRQNGTIKAENISPSGARFIIKFYK